MREQTKNMLIGAFILIACAFTVSIVLFLKPSVGDGKKTYYVRFSNINKIGLGTRVMFAGKPVGEVVAVSTIYDARSQPIDSAGRVYFYQLTLKVDSSVQIYSTDDIAIQTSGLLGEKSIAIVPKPPLKGIIPKLIAENEPIYAESVDPIESAFEELSDLATTMQDTFKEVTCWIQENGNNLSNAVCQFGGAMEEAKNTLHSVNTLGIIPDVKEAISHFSSTFSEMQTALVTMREGKVFTNTSAFMENLKTVSDAIATGKGTVGKLIMQDDFYLRLTSIMSKADTLMNDINHYGILFHLNKSWQRLRVQRAHLLESLDTPQAFRNYFQEEVDGINTSMARLSMLLEKTTPAMDIDFEKDFAELLRSVDALSDNLKLYNEELIQKKEAN